MGHLLVDPGIHGRPSPALPESAPAENLLKVEQLLTVPMLDHQRTIMREVMGNAVEHAFVDSATQSGYPELDPTETRSIAGTSCRQRVR